MWPVTPEQGEFQYRSFWTLTHLKFFGGEPRKFWNQFWILVLRAYSHNKFGPHTPTLVFNIGGFGAPNFNGGSPPKFWTQFLKLHLYPTMWARKVPCRWSHLGDPVAKEKKRKKKETSAVKYNTSGHYRGRRYNEWMNGSYWHCQGHLEGQSDKSKFTITSEGFLGRFDPFLTVTKMFV